MGNRILEALEQYDNVLYFSVESLAGPGIGRESDLLIMGDLATLKAGMVVRMFDHEELAALICWTADTYRDLDKKGGL